MDGDAAVPPQHNSGAGAGHASSARAGHAGGAGAGHTSNAGAGHTNDAGTGHTSDAGAGHAHAALQPSAASPGAGHDAPTGAGLRGEETTPFPLQRPALRDCKGTEMSTQDFFWRPNPWLTVSMPRTSKAGS